MYMPESMSSPIRGYSRVVSGVVLGSFGGSFQTPPISAQQILLTPRRSQYIPLHPDKFHQIPASHSGGLAFHFVCRHRVIIWSVAFCSYKIQSEAFPLNIYKGENIRFAAKVSILFLFSNHQNIAFPQAIWHGWCDHDVKGSHRLPRIGIMLPQKSWCD